METTINLSKTQQLSLEKLRALVGSEQMDLIIAQGPDVIHARLVAFMQYEFDLNWAIIRPFGIRYAFSVCSHTIEEPWDRPLVLSVDTFAGEKRENPWVGQRGGNGHEIINVPIGSTANRCGYLETGWVNQRVDYYV